MNLKDFIRDIPDFPVKGVIFRDITPLLKNPDALNYAVDKLIEKAQKWDFDYIVAPEARGFIFSSILSYKMKKGLIPVRKPGKLPYKTVEITYELEYGTETLQMHADALKEGDKVIIVDDVVATGGTIKAIIDLVESQNAKVQGVLSLIELTFLEPRKKIGNYEFETLIQY